MIWTLLRHNISKAQIAAFAVAAMAGLSVIMAGVQFYADMRPLFAGDDASADEYIEISKPVSLFSAFGAPDGFSDSEIDEIMRQPWTRDAGRFRPADFGVTAAADFAGRGVSTALFFESVPDRFIDELPDDWGFDSVRPEVAVILPRNYLALYNFGFAATRGLPRLSEKAICAMPLSVVLAGNGRVERLPARIVGFSDRLNTVAVPDAFIDWASRRYGSGTLPAAQRLIVRVVPTAMSDAVAYIEAAGYEIAGERAGESRAAVLLATVSAVAGGIGLVICLLAIVILVLSIFLLLQKNRRAIRGLLFLGYSPVEVAMPYVRLVAVVSVFVLALSVSAVVCVRGLWLDAAGVSGTWPVSAVVGFALMAAVVSLASAIVMRRVRRYY